MRTTGSRWQYLQTEYFNNNSQPWYVLLSPDTDQSGKLHMLTESVGYTPDENEYEDFLKCGLET